MNTPMENLIDMKEFTNQKNNCLIHKWRWLGPCRSSIKQLLQEENKDDRRWESDPGPTVDGWSATFTLVSNWKTHISYRLFAHICLYASFHFNRHVFKTCKKP